MSLLDAHVAAPAPARRPLRYERVMALVEDIIASRGLQPGSLLPTQHELAKMTGVSLITVRRALQALESAGKVTGHQGVGTFVARPRIVSDSARSGGLLGTFGEQAQMRHVETEVLELRPGVPRSAVSHALHLPPGELVWQLSRLRRIDGKPLIVEDALIPQRLAPDLNDRRDSLSGSLYELLARDHGLVDDHEEQYLEVITAGRRERRLLELSGRAKAVRLRGVSFTAEGVPFDCFAQVYPAEEFVFYISGQTARRLFRPADLNDWGVSPLNSKGGQSHNRV